MRWADINLGALEANCARILAHLPKGTRLLLAPLGQRQIGAAGMLTGEAPGGFAVPRKIDDGQRFTHDLLLRRCPAGKPYGAYIDLIQGGYQTGKCLQYKAQKARHSVAGMFIIPPAAV